MRIDREDWSKTVDDLLKDETYQIAVVMFGANDNQAIKSGKEYVKPGTEEWDALYGQRVEAFIKKLRAANVAVYWVGLPIMRSPGQNADAEALNDVYREKAFINGAKFIETWNGFTDEAGRFSAYGPDMTGQVKRLRADDGVHFPIVGKRFGEAGHVQSGKVGDAESMLFSTKTLVDFAAAYFRESLE